LGPSIYTADKTQLRVDGSLMMMDTKLMMMMAASNNLGIATTTAGTCAQAAAAAAHCPPGGQQFSKVASPQLFPDHFSASFTGPVNGAATSAQVFHHLNTLPSSSSLIFPDSSVDTTPVHQSLLNNGMLISTCHYCLH
jgi:hypothetical protein